MNQLSFQVAPVDFDYTLERTQNIVTNLGLNGTLTTNRLQILISFFVETYKDQVLLIESDEKKSTITVKAANTHFL